MSLLHALSRCTGAEKQFRVLFLENEFRCPVNVVQVRDQEYPPKIFAALTEMFGAGIDLFKYLVCRKVMRSLNDGNVPS